MFETTRQSGVFLAMVYTGLLSGIGYDVLRVLRNLFHAGKIASAAADLIFWLGASAICGYTLMQISHEPLRLYALLGALCGMLLYLAGVSEVLYACIRAPWRLGHAIMDKIRLKKEKK